jgi:hypothetical protein
MKFEIKREKHSRGLCCLKILQWHLGFAGCSFYVCHYQIPHHSHFLYLSLSLCGGFFSGNTGLDLESNTWAKVICTCYIMLYMCSSTKHNISHIENRTNYKVHILYYMNHDHIITLITYY